MDDTTIILNYQFGPSDQQGVTRVTARLILPGQNPEGKDANVRLPLDELEKLGKRSPGYATRLTESFFAERTIYSQLVKARTTQQNSGTRLQLHIRFEIPRDAVRLHAVIWELLGDPDADGMPPLGRGERVFISRYLLPSKQRPGDMTPRKLRALALLANPRKDKDGFALELDPVDIAAEQKLLETKLGVTQLRLLAGADASGRRLADELSKGCDLLYLACHGTLLDDQPRLYLETTDNVADIVTAEAMVEKVLGLQAIPPRLVVFAACQTAGGGTESEREDNGFLFAARLVDSGVPAVVGMQGSVSETTSLAFMSELLENVLADGQVERAMSVARSNVQSSDSWMPVLVSSASGRLWPPSPPPPNLKALLRSFSTGNCLPILGPGLIDEFSNAGFAHYLRGKMGGTLLMGANPEPSKIAQEYKVLSSPANNPNGVEIEFRNFIEDRLNESGIWPIDNEDLDTRVLRWGADGKRANSLRSVEILASLPVPVFVTTNGDSLLQQAMKKLDPPKDPETEILPWWGESKGVDLQDKIQALKERRVGADAPTIARPLVTHLFGHYKEPSSLVLTEDDFFDYLIWLVAARQSVWIRQRFCQCSLMFLGFRLEDWEFRLLLRSINRLPGRELLRSKAHVAVQIEQTAGTSQSEIREKLESYFKNTDFTLSIFFGTAESFLVELQQQLVAAGLVGQPELATAART